MSSCTEGWEELPKKRLNYKVFCESGPDSDEFEEGGCDSHICQDPATLDDLRSFDHVQKVEAAIAERRLKETGKASGSESDEEAPPPKRQARPASPDSPRGSSFRDFFGCEPWE